MGEKSAETQDKEIRQWLSTLLTETFFTPCPPHESLKKTSGLKNFLCLDCCSTFCSECPFSQCSHDPRRVLQIRRYLCRDVVRVDDLASFIDPSFIQPYICNNARVVFINERKGTRTRNRNTSGTGSPCLTCGRGLPADCFYCCLNCKVEHLRAAGGLANLWMKGESLPSPNSTELDESLSTPNSTELDESEFIPDSSGKTDTSSPSESTASGAAGDTGPSGTAAGSGLSKVTRIRRSRIAGGSDLPGPTESGSPNVLRPPKASGLGSTSGSDPRCTTGLGSPNKSDPRGASGLGSTSGSGPQGASGLGAQNRSDQAGTSGLGAQNRSDQAGTSGLGPPNGSDPRGASGLGSTSGSDPQGASGLGPPNRSDPRGTSGSGSRHRRKGIPRRAPFF